jgi:uncharacterized protein VirK/YbjX
MRNQYLLPTTGGMVANFSSLAGSLELMRRAAFALYPEQTPFHRWRRVCFYLRSALTWDITMAWLQRCSNSVFHGIVQRQASVLERIHRPFLYKNLGPRGRLAVSLDHYEIALLRAPHLARRIASEGRVSIASFATGSERWWISLEADMQFQSEGDWTLVIRDEADWRLVSCTFSFTYPKGREGGPHLCIGCVQGPDTHTNGREMFRALTKNWHGLGPKVFVVYLAQCVAEALRVEETLIVSNRTHVYASWRYFLRKKRVSVDYDALSRECGAVAQRDGWFVLRPQTPPVSSGESGRTKNGPRRKRNALSTNLALQIMECITALG